MLRLYLSISFEEAGKALQIICSKGAQWTIKRKCLRIPIAIGMHSAALCEGQPLAFCRNY